MTLKEHIDDIRKGLEAGQYGNEAAVSQGIVLRLLNILAWPTFDTQVVIPEYGVEGTRVDYALCHPLSKPRVFIEAKQVGNIKGAEEQLFGYDSRVRVPIAVLTDGREWQFFHHIPGEVLLMIGIENIDYLSNQLITYIGNKRSLLGHIGRAVVQVKKQIGKSHLRVFDAFSGSGVVSRFMKAHASYIASNDFEDYAASISRCYLQNRSSVDLTTIAKIVAELNHRVNEPSPKGFIERLYAPKYESRITQNDRVFYTRDNARRLDNYRRMIEDYPENFRDSLLGPLLSKASVHSNTSGVFKGFYKNKMTGIGQYGGTNSNALSRIKGGIELEPPVLSQFECDYEVYHDDTNKIASQIKELDLTYIDPPYNQHPYGSNYFMLNLLVHYEEPTDISRVSGIPKDWKRSGYNFQTKSKELFNGLLHTIDTRFFLISFNNEGFIPPDEIRTMLRKIGTVDEFEIRYNTFRGSRNLRNRNIHVTEQLFLVERKFNGK